MNRKGTESIAEPIAQLQRQLEDYRRIQPRRAKLPESLWESAAELAREHGVSAVAQALRLDYMGLKKRLGDVASRSAGKSKSVFVELIALPPRARREDADPLAGPHRPGLDGVTARLARH